MTRQIILQPLHVCSYLIYKSFLSLGAGILKPNTAFFYYTAYLGLVTFVLKKSHAKRFKGNTLMHIMLNNL